jgi:hypothetical protein
MEGGEGGGTVCMQRGSERLCVYGGREREEGEQDERKRLSSSVLTVSTRVRRPRSIILHYNISLYIYILRVGHRYI